MNGQAGFSAGGGKAQGRKGGEDPLTTSKNRQAQQLSSAPKKNLRPLAVITADIYKAERANIITIGRLLLEAKEQADHGKWLPYLRSIGWSGRNAQLYMSVARLAAKYEIISHLNAAPTALYHLVWRAEHADPVISNSVPVAIERLQKSVARGDSAKKQWDAVELSSYAIAHPHATELALRAASDAVNQSCFGDSDRYKAMMVQGREIIKANPKTDEELKAVKAKHPVPLPAGRIVVEPDEEEEAPATGKEPKEDLLPRQRALVDQFNHACEELLTLASKASTVFLHSDVTAHDLDLLGNFLKQVAASKRKGAR